MTQLTRRRFLTISAAAAGFGGPARGASLHRWEGVALGARTSITLDHPDASEITERARAEIARLEQVFSLYREDSALVRLNRDGRLANPPFELLECLGQCTAVHAATGGAFDPTVQPLWTLYARQLGEGGSPAHEDIAKALKAVGWRHVAFDAQEIRLSRPGMALTLNGIAQGYIADRVAALLRRQGLTDVLVDTGEMRALGGMPGTGGAGWPVSLRAGQRQVKDALRLRDMALASSAPFGTVLDAEGRVGHVLDPRSGTPAPGRWQLVSITAPSAAIADGLSTAGCLLSRAELQHAMTQFRAANIVHLA